MLHGFSKPKTPDYLRRAEAKGKMYTFKHLAWVHSLSMT